MPFPTSINNLVGGLIKNKKGKILLVKSPLRGWEFPETQVKIEEDHVEALKRVVKEKAYISISVNKVVGIFTNINTEAQSDCKTHISKDIYIDFICTQSCEGVRTMEKGLEVGWFNENEVLDKVTHPFVKERLKHMLDFSGSIHIQSKKIVKGF